MNDLMNDAAEDTEAGGAAAAAPSSGEAAELRRERDDYYDRLLRKTAEFDNYRKRTDRERRELIDTAAADVLGELLSIVDDLERALDADAGQEGTDAHAYRKGVEIIRRNLMELLRKHGVTPIEAVGRPFDPHVHQAVVHEESPEHADGEVIEEFRRGYMLGDRLLRASMVKVAKA
jgi:molecular chaperone GrpE